MFPLLLAVAHADEPAPPLALAVQVGVTDAFTLGLPERVGVGATTARGPFWAEVGVAAGTSTEPSNLDLVLLTIANAGNPDGGLTRVVRQDRWSAQLGVGVGDPTRVASRPAGSPFLWIGGEVRDVQRTEIAYGPEGYVEVGADGGVEVGPVIKAGFLVGVGPHFGVRLAVEDRPRPDPNRASGGWEQDVDFALDLSWRF